LITSLANTGWHFFEQFVVCLGLVKPVVKPRTQPSFTTMEQSLMLGTVTVSKNASLHARGGEVFPAGKLQTFHDDVRWIHHGRSDGRKGTAYIPVVPESRTMTLDTHNRTGNWSDIGVGSGASTLPVFDLYLTHTARVSVANVSTNRFTTSQQYGYLVLPSTSADEVANFDPSQVQTVITQATNAVFVQPPSQPTDGTTAGMMSAARCAFSGRNFISRMPLDPTQVRLKRTCV
jgi:hypothetical protein